MPRRRNSRRRASGSLRRGTVRVGRRGFRALRRASAPVQVLAGLAVLVAAWLALNGIYQVVRKPSELFFPVAGTLNKAPAETWRSYAPLFRKYSTALISPELLAALAQVEGAGNPVARTYWRWSLRPRPFDIYRPASSAVGMYQLTDGTFAIARRYCIRDHRVVADGPWNDWGSCWFNGLYSRVIPSHAVELTAAYLDLDAAALLGRYRMRRAASPERVRELAALIHLCGAGAADAFVRRGMHLDADERCGDHSALDYVTRVEFYAREFMRLAAAD
jgi:hypothetical protein